MRATEALALANPETSFNNDTFYKITHIDLEREREIIKKARQKNRKDAKSS